MQHKLRIKRNDQVEVIAGKDKGRVGKVLKVIKDKDRAIVEKVNMIKRHTKPNMMNQQGGIIEKEASVHISNLMLICSKCAGPVRVGFKNFDDGNKVRFCKKCGGTIEPKA